MNSWQGELAENSASKKLIKVVREARTVGIQEKLKCQNCHEPQSQEDKSWYMVLTEDGTSIL